MANAPELFGPFRAKPFFSNVDLAHCPAKEFNSRFHCFSTLPSDASLYTDACVVVLKL